MATGGARATEVVPPPAYTRTNTPSDGYYRRTYDQKATFLTSTGWTTALVLFTLFWALALSILTYDLLENGFHRDMSSDTSDALSIIFTGAIFAAAACGLGCAVPSLEVHLQGSDRTSVLTAQNGGRELKGSYASNARLRGSSGITMACLGGGGCLAFVAAVAALVTVSVMAADCENWHGCCFEGDPVDPCICCSPNQPAAPIDPLTGNPAECTTADGVQETPWNTEFKWAFGLVLTGSILTLLFLFLVGCCWVFPSFAGKYDSNGAWKDPAKDGQGGAGGTEWKPVS